MKGRGYINVFCNKVMVGLALLGRETMGCSVSSSPRPSPYHGEGVLKSFNFSYSFVSQRRGISILTPFAIGERWFRLLSKSD